MQPIQIYLAGTYWFGIGKDQKEFNKLLDSEKPFALNVKQRLESYHYVGKQKLVDDIRASGEQIFLDSGAFSAKSLGIEISIEEYCQYIQLNEDIIRKDDGVLVASVLDAIGDPQATYENQKRMEQLGVRPLPCFHQGEDERYLEYYLANYEYITVGGIVGGNPVQLEIWLDRIFNNHILDGAGNPRAKVHGFGMTSIPLMERYPWYSCDSSSWIQTTAFGSVTIPTAGNLNVSKESPDRHNAGKHLDTLTPIEKDYIEGLIRAAGHDPDELRKRYHARAVYNIWAYQEIERLINIKKTSMAKRQPIKQELF